MKQKLLWSDKLLWHGLTGTQQGEEKLTLLINFQHWWPWREKQKTKLQTYQGSYIMWHVNCLSHWGCSDLISTCFLSDPITCRQIKYRCEHTVGTFEIQSLRPHSKVGWVASDNILLAVCTDLWPEPHWRTTYSTDVLQEEATTITMDSTLSDSYEVHCSVKHCMFQLTTEPVTTISPDFFINHMILGVAVWGETLLQYILNYWCPL